MHWLIFIAGKLLVDHCTYNACSKLLSIFFSLFQDVLPTKFFGINCLHSCFSITKHELKTLAQVIMTAENNWNPSMYDSNIDYMEISYGAYDQPAAIHST
jgi:hypothetical protein